MPDRILIILATSYVAYTCVLLYVFSHPSYTWSPQEVAREHIYDYQNPFNER